MEQIRIGEEEGIDVSQYADTLINAVQMKEMREQIENDGKVQEEPQLNELQSQEILLGLQSGVDVSVYADARYTCRQMEQIRIMLERGLDPSELLVYKDQ